MSTCTSYVHTHLYYGYALEGGTLLLLLITHTEFSDFKNSWFRAYKFYLFNSDNIHALTYYCLIIIACTYFSDNASHR